MAEKSIIRIDNLSKTFSTKDGDVTALKGINLDIKEGEIFGIIGMSGAGKSTLVRCMNLLERPTEGKVFFEDQNLLELSEKELNLKRRSIAMIFQQFNLLMQRNILKNVRYPLELAGAKKEEAGKRAMELLRLVGLEEKAKAYPSQLSGGQKQRVAIARALASNPKVLLCDEATSALDPKTTREVLDQLKKINKELGITIIVITHEMKVIEEICNRVAIIADSKIAEIGPVMQIFSSPRTEAAKRLVFGEGRLRGSDSVYKGDENAKSGSIVSDNKEVQESSYDSGDLDDTIRAFANDKDKFVRIVFDGKSSYEPVIANMIMEFKTPVNIMLANTRNIAGNAVGQMVLQLPTEPELRSRMLQYLIDKGLSAEEVDANDY